MLWRGCLLALFLSGCMAPEDSRPDTEQTTVATGSAFLDEALAHAVAYVSFYADTDESLAVEIECDDDGRFSADLPAEGGLYRLRVEHPRLNDRLVFVARLEAGNTRYVTQSPLDDVDVELRSGPMDVGRRKPSLSEAEG